MIEKERYHILNVESKYEDKCGDDLPVVPTVVEHKEENHQHDPCEPPVEKILKIRMHEDDSIATVKFTNLDI